ncbi:MAG: FecR domain-containing protein [Prolixibacteraceae bacterium]
MEKKFTKYWNGTANPEEFSSVLEALCGEDNNGKVSLELLKRWEETLDNAIENKENSHLLDKIHHRIALEESKAVARRLSIYQNLLKVAAVLILGLVISTLVIIRKQQPVNTNVVETVTTPYGARTNFKLPDGSEVWLNSGTTISFPRQYGETRNVELSGQAFFKVVKDGKPFVVKTGFGRIEVMGTSFDAKAYANDNFETTLVEGSVKIVDGNNRTTTLKPGQQATVTPAGEFSMLNVNTGNITSWREGKLIFVKTPFVEVVKDLERWYNVKIELQGERLKKIGYTGTIELETFGEVLELINVTTPIKYSFNKQSRILKISGR